MDSIPYGYCHCGCGRRTRRSKINSPKWGLVRGRPRLYWGVHHIHPLVKPELRAPRTREAEQRKALVSQIRANTYCARCGAQPIDWHHESHPQNVERRICRMAATGKSESDILDEIARCTPLCRTCHMIVDGRLEALVQRERKHKPPRPCICCGVMMTPHTIRKEMCTRCAAKARRRAGAR